MKNFIDDEELDRQLRDATPYIDDDGFTAKVLHRLPAQPVAAPERVRATILIMVTVLASVLAYFLSGGGRFVDVALVRLSALPTSWLIGLASAAAFSVCAFGLAAAVFKAREPALTIR